MLLFGYIAAALFVLAEIMLLMADYHNNESL